jgi:hypothetical protein
MVSMVCLGNSYSTILGGWENGQMLSGPPIVKYAIACERWT